MGRRVRLVEDHAGMGLDLESQPSVAGHDVIGVAVALAARQSGY